MVKVSIVVPVYYNDANLYPLYDDLKAKVLDVAEFESEIIFVDDGSRDGSWSVILDLCARDARIKGYRLSRNFGSHAAILCGLSKATGDCAVVKAADLQEPSEIILEMYEMWKRGNNVVLAVREGRSDGSFFTKLYYSITKKFALPTMPAEGFDVYLVDRKVIDVLDKMDERNSALTGQLLWSGFKTEKVFYTRLERTAGKSRWTLKKKLRLVTDTLFSFSSVPITFVSCVGALCCLGSVAWAIYVLVSKLLGAIPVEGYTTLFIFQLFSFGITMITLGILGGYLWRAFDASRERPVYIVEDRYDAMDDRAERIADAIRARQIASTDPAASVAAERARLEWIASVEADADAAAEKIKAERLAAAQKLADAEAERIKSDWAAAAGAEAAAEADRIRREAAKAAEAEAEEEGRRIRAEKLADAEKLAALEAERIKSDKIAVAEAEAVAEVEQLLRDREAARAQAVAEAESTRRELTAAAEAEAAQETARIRAEKIAAAEEDAAAEAERIKSEKIAAAEAEAVAEVEQLLRDREAAKAEAEAEAEKIKREKIAAAEIEASAEAERVKNSIITAAVSEAQAEAERVKSERIAAAEAQTDEEAERIKNERIAAAEAEAEAEAERIKSEKVSAARALAEEEYERTKSDAAAAVQAEMDVEAERIKSEKIAAAETEAVAEAERVRLEKISAAETEAAAAAEQLKDEKLAAAQMLADAADAAARPQSPAQKSAAASEPDGGEAARYVTSSFAPAAQAPLPTPQVSAPQSGNSEREYEREPFDAPLDDFAPLAQELPVPFEEPAQLPAADIDDLLFADEEELFPSPEPEPMIFGREVFEAIAGADEPEEPAVSAEPESAGDETPAPRAQEAAPLERQKPSAADVEALLRAALSKDEQG